MQNKFSRHIKLLICVTLYNEDQDTMGKTLLGICEVSWGALGDHDTWPIPLCFLPHGGTEGHHSSALACWVA